MLLNTSSHVISGLVLLAASVQANQVVLGNDQAEYFPFHPAFDDFVETLLKEWHIPGIAIAVVHENHTCAKGYGYATLPHEPVTPYTLFQGASTTKSFTASLAALLVDNTDEYAGLSWSTSLHSLVGNDFVLVDDHLTSQVTLQDALSHRTGIPRHDTVWVNNEISVEGEVHALRHLPPSAPLRTKWQYCNLMFTAVSHVLQTLTSKWQGDLLREWLWEPLNMTQSFYSYEQAHRCKTTEPQCRLATSYAWNNESSSFDAIAESSFHAANGAGGIISNVMDYSNWLRALMYEDGPVSKAGHAAIKSPLSIEAAEKYPYSGPLWYGMGLEGGVYRGERVFGHGGSIGGYYSHFTFLPGKKWGYVAFGNAAGNVVDTVGWRLLDEFLKTPKDEVAKMNEHYHSQAAKQYEATRAMPSLLFPDIPPHALHPQLALESYTGIYHHPGYGFVNLTLTPPSTVSQPLSTEASPLLQSEDASTAPPTLYARSVYENTLYTLRHVSGEHWLLELRSHVHSGEVADGYSKAKFDIGPRGEVERVGVIIQEGTGWAWYTRVGDFAEQLEV